MKEEIPVEYYLMQNGETIKFVRYEIIEKLKEYILTHKIYDEVKFKSELLKIIGGE